MTDDARPEPLALRLSVTDRCELRCTYCMPVEGVPKVEREEILSFEEIVRFVRVLKQGFGVSKVRITGGEPLVRAGLPHLLEALARLDLPDLALTTNGQRLSELAAPLAAAGLRRINVSLDSLDPDGFRSLTRGGDLQRTLNGIDAAIQHALTPVKLNCVVLRDHNLDQVVDLARFAFERGCPMRFLELMPIGCAAPMHAESFVPTEEVRARLEGAFRLGALPFRPGDTSRNYTASDAAGLSGTVGFISPRSRPFCSGCRRVRLTSTGRLVTCLARGGGPDIRGLLRDDAPEAGRLLCETVADQLSIKGERAVFSTAHLMGTTGG